MNLKNYPIMALLLKRNPEILNTTATALNKNPPEKRLPVQPMDGINEDEKNNDMNKMFEQLDVLFGEDD
jgi:hypothetical protein